MDRVRVRRIPLRAFIERVSAKSNRLGIFADTGTLRNCSGSRNNVGVDAAFSVVEGNTLSSNGGVGLLASRSTVIANTFQNNAVDLDAILSVYGSNNFTDNPPNSGFGNTSQNNNNYSGTSC